MTIPVWNDYKNFRKLTDEELDKDINSLVKWKADKNENKLIGNKTIYHYQFENIAKTKSDSGHTKSFYEWINDDILKVKLYNFMIKRNRNKERFSCLGRGCDAKLVSQRQPLVEDCSPGTPLRSNRNSILSEYFEALRANKGSVVIFRPSTAKFIYKYYNATNVLDFSAGWGGRMLGAFALNIGYTGIDTNINLKEGYDKFIFKTGKENLKMIYQNCLDVDLSKIEYDLVLTSPPYENVEIYENMKLFKNQNEFYIDFLIKMIDRCLYYIKNNGWVCINISGKMYKILTEKYKYRECDEKHILPQSKNQRNPNKIDYIFCWKSQ